MSGSTSPSGREMIEREVLRALCQYFDDESFRADTLCLLARYRFSAPDHQCIFDALHQVSASTPHALRQHLTARLNNMGFPEMDIEHLFQGSPFTIDKTTDLIRELLGSTGEPR